MSDAARANAYGAERVDKWRAGVAEGLEPVYDDLLDAGCAPRRAAAAVCYASGKLTADGPKLAAVAARYDVSASTVSKWHTECLDDIRASRRSAAEQAFVDNWGTGE